MSERNVIRTDATPCISIARAALRRLIPAPARRVVREELEDRRVQRAIRPLRERGYFTVAELGEFRSAWGNKGFSADERYLSETIRLINQYPGDVLECGTGATTVIAGVLAERYGFHVYSLEQDPAWSVRAKRAVKRGKLTQVQILDLPLKKYSDYMWYDTGNVSLPKRFGLVICDGPFIDKALGDPMFSSWRYGVLEFLKLTRSSYRTLLLDDVNDARAPAIIARWQNCFRLEVQVSRASEGDLGIIEPTQITLENG